MCKVDSIGQSDALKTSRWHIFIYIRGHFTIFCDIVKFFPIWPWFSISSLILELGVQYLLHDLQNTNFEHKYEFEGCQLYEIKLGMFSFGSTTSILLLLYYYHGSFFQCTIKFFVIVNEQTLKMFYLKRSGISWWDSWTCCCPPESN